MKTRDLSRREVLVRAAVGVASLNVAAALTALSRTARADDDGEGDVGQLNVALGAEYEAIATYTSAAPLLAQDATMTKAARDALAALTAQFQAHHVEHAAALKKLIQSSGGTPRADSGKPNLPASFPTAAKAMDVVKLAADREKHAAIAYARALS
ncbi:MAG TPA: ferritin-like domain-containing protein, partial [Polyangiaceae bacterium]|nr:ferritin-like domain-containing protein [Polyangiaceae bacterium]